MGARLLQLLRSSLCPFWVQCLQGPQGERSPRDLCPGTWDPPPWSVEPGARLGIWVLAAPQRHLLALDGNSFEIGVFQVALAPAALDPGWASDPWDLSLSTDS